MTKEKVDLDKIAQWLAGYLNRNHREHRFTAVRMDEYRDTVAVLIDGNDPNQDFRIMMRLDSRSGKLVVRGDKPKTIDGSERPYSHEFWPESINVSPHRDGISLSKDIDHRLVNDYIPAFRQAREQCEQYNHSLNLTRSNMEEIAKIVRGTPKQNSDRIDVRNPDLKKGYINDLSVRTEDVSMDLRSVPMELAKEILTIFMRDK